MDFAILFHWDECCPGILSINVYIRLSIINVDDSSWWLICQETCVYVKITGFIDFVNWFVICLKISDTVVLWTCQNLQKIASLCNFVWWKCKKIVTRWS